MDINFNITQATLSTTSLASWSIPPNMKCLFQARGEGETGYLRGAREEAVKALFNMTPKAREELLAGAAERGMSINLSGLWLKDHDFSQLDLRGADFRFCVLIDAKFNEADLNFANFELANIRGADFEGAEVENAKFQDVNCLMQSKGLIPGTPVQEEPVVSVASMKPGHAPQAPNALHHDAPKPEMTTHASVYGAQLANTSRRETSGISRTTVAPHAPHAPHSTQMLHTGAPQVDNRPTTVSGTYAFNTSNISGAKELKEIQPGDVEMIRATLRDKVALLPAKPPHVDPTALDYTDWKKPPRTHQERWDARIRQMQIMLKENNPELFVKEGRDNHLMACSVDGEIVGLMSASKLNSVSYVNINGIVTMPGPGRAGTALVEEAVNYSQKNGREGRLMQQPLCDDSKEAFKRLGFTCEVIGHLPVWQLDPAKSNRWEKRESDGQVTWHAKKQ